MKYTFLLIGWLLCLGQGTCAQSPALRQIAVEQGLPSLTVYRILQDQRGYLWMGTQTGICKFDGRTFQTWELNHLHDKEIILMYEDKWGKIWFKNLSGQIGTIDGEDLKIYQKEDFGLQSQPFGMQVSGMYLFIWEKEYSNYTLTKYRLDENGGIQKDKTYQGVVEVTLTNLFVNQGQVFFSLMFERNNAYKYFGIKDDSLAAINMQTNYSDLRNLDSDSEGSPTEPFRFELRHISEEGIKFYSSKGKIYIEDKNEITPLIDFSKAEINAIKYFSGNLWVLTSSGASVINLKNRKQKLDFLSGHSCSQVIRDTEGNYWVTTTDAGIFMIPNLDISIYSAKDGLHENENVNSLLFVDVDSLLYAGVSGGEIAVFNLKDSSLSYYQTGNEGRIMSMVSDRRERLWIGQDTYATVFDVKDSVLTRVTGSGGIKKILETAAGEILIADSYGVDLVSESASVNSSIETREIFFKRSYGLAEDSSKTVWIGSIEGLYLYENGIVEPFIENGRHEKYKVSAILCDADNNLWVSTSGHGILKIKNRRVAERLNNKNGWMFNNCLLLYTLEEKLYIRTDKGLVIYNTKQKSYDLINEFDGLPSNEIQAVYVDEKNIWMGTPKGLVRMPVKRIPSNQQPPEIYLKRFSILGIDTTLLQDYDLAFNENAIDISYEGIALSAKGKERYMYRLKGLKNEWNYTNNRTARFHSLPPGTYNFEVYAINEQNVKSRQAAHCSFTIATPWWKTDWFYLLAILGVALMTGGLVYWWQHEKRKRERIENELNEKIRNLSLEALQSQLNPHFIFNALNAIQDFFVNKDSRSALFYLSKFAQLIRLIFDYSKRNTIFLEDELVFLNLYLEIEKLRFGDRVEIDLQVDQSIDQQSEEFELPPLMIQPIVENCFKHGLMHKTQGGKLTIRFEIPEEGHLHCMVEDNGVGRESTKNLSEWQGQPTREGGARVIADRLKLFHQYRPAGESYLLVTDLTNPEGQACGTRVDIHIYNEIMSYAT